MGRGNGSLKYQIIKDLDPLQAYGESKHEAKKAERERCEREGIKYNPGRVEKIYSIKTYDTYKHECIRFGEWAKQEHNIRHIDDLKQPEIVREYLEHRQSEGDSAWSLRTTGSAIGKMCRCSSTTFDFKYPPRVNTEVVRSTLERAHDREINMHTHKDLVRFLQGSGLRREEVSKIVPEQIRETSLGVKIEFNKEKFGSQTKGGRDREVHVREEYRSHVLEMRDKAISEMRDKVFQHVPNRLDVHSIRREYAIGRYNEIAKEIRVNGGEVKDNYHTRDGSGRHFNREILQKVSNDLGHNRICITATNYLRGL